MIHSGIEPSSHSAAHTACPGYVALLLAAARAVGAVITATVLVGAVLTAVPLDAAHGQETDETGAREAIERGVVKIEGEVLDDASGMPVADAIVLLPILGAFTITDDFGYFAFESVPVGVYEITAYRTGYQAFQAEAPAVPDEVLVLKLAPSPIVLPGVTVEAQSAEELMNQRFGRESDFISRQEVAEAGERTSQILEVIRSKAPPRLQIRQQGGYGGISFCIQSTRRAPSVQELTDLGTGCRTVMLVVDGVVVYAPPAITDAAATEIASLPEDVAQMILGQNPNEIETIRVLSPSDGYFRYGVPGRLGAVEIKTRHPRRSKRDS